MQEGELMQAEGEYCLKHGGHLSYVGIRLVESFCGVGHEGTCKVSRMQVAVRLANVGVTR